MFPERKAEFMSAIEVTNGDEIVRAAFWLAWKELQLISQTADERRSSAQSLQRYIRVLVDAGEHDTGEIVVKALGLLRQSEQIARSRARVLSPGDDAASAS